MLRPDQFQVNEAWIAFQLNDDPIETERDGSFNCVCLMDAASCFILGNALVPVSQPEPSELEVRRLLKAAWARTKRFPSTLFLPRGQFKTALTAQAKRRGISVVAVKEDGLLVFIDEARQGFRQRFKGGDSDA